MTCKPPLYSSSNFWLHDGIDGHPPQVYIDRAPTLPDDPTIPALSFPAGGGPLQQFDVATQTWEGVAAVSGGPTTSSGIFALQVYIDRAPALPDNPEIPALSFPAGGGAMQQFDPTTQTWY